MKSDDKSASTEAVASKITSTNDGPLDEISSSISEMVSQFVDEMLNTPLYADPFSSATENMLDKNDWKLALTPSYIQERIQVYVNPTTGCLKFNLIQTLFVQFETPS